MRHISLLVALAAATLPEEEYHHTQLLQTKVQHPKQPSPDVATIVKFFKHRTLGRPGGKKGKKGQQGGGAEGGQQGGGAEGGRQGGGAEGGPDEDEQKCEECAMGCIFPDGFPKEETSWQSQPVCYDGESCLASDDFMGCFLDCLGDGHPIGTAVTQCKNDFPDNAFMCLECGGECGEAAGCGPGECGENQAFTECHANCMTQTEDDDEVMEHAEEGEPGNPPPPPGPPALMQMKRIFEQMKHNAHGGPGGKRGNRGQQGGPEEGGRQGGGAEGGRQGGGAEGGRQGGGAEGGRQGGGAEGGPDEDEQDEDEKKCEECAMGCIFPDGFPKEETSWQSQPVCYDGESCLASDDFMGCFLDCLGDGHPIGTAVTQCQTDFPDNAFMCLECGGHCGEAAGCGPGECGENPAFTECHANCMTQTEDDDEVMEHAEEGAPTDGTDLMQIKQHMKRMAKK